MMWLVDDMHGALLPCLINFNLNNGRDSSGNNLRNQAMVH